MPLAAGLAAVLFKLCCQAPGCLTGVRQPGVQMTTLHRANLQSTVELVKRSGSHHDIWSSHRLAPSQPTQDGCRVEEQPDFLPMVPWYSGTSADMYKTVFDLIISVKLFLGRFDMRTMQVRHP